MKHLRTAGLLAGVVGCLASLSCGRVSGYAKVSKAASNPYQGCTAVAPATAYALKVTYVFPAAADEIQILRNDVVVYESADHTKTDFIDQNLDVNGAYTYTCQILANGETIQGAVGQKATVADPLAGYAGCVQGTVINGSDAQITFQFPSGATKADVTMNGNIFFTTSDNTVTTAVTDTLDVGKIYEFACEVEINGVVKQGGTKVTVSIPDPLSAGFTGCLTVTPLDAFDVEINYQYPDGVDSVAITRDGQQVFTSDSPPTGGSGNYTDKQLTQDTKYLYACTATVGPRTTTGTNQVSVSTMTLPELAYTTSKSTAFLVNQSVSMVPTQLDNHGQTIAACAIKSGTTALPTGVTIDATSCTISGTAAASVAQTTYTVIATSAAGDSADASVTFSVVAALPQVSYTGATGTTGTHNTLMTITPTSLVSNGSAITGCHLSSGIFPANTNLVINATTCVISGTPTVPLATTSFGIIVTNGIGDAQNVATVAITIN